MKLYACSAVYLGEAVEWEQIWDVYTVWKSQRISKNKYKFCFLFISIFKYLTWAWHKYIKHAAYSSFWSYYSWVTVAMSRILDARSMHGYKHLSFWESDKIIEEQV